MRLRLVPATAALMLGLIIGFAGESAGQGLNGNSFQNWNFLGGGARARGMGGAYLGISDDVYAASWNPAGLVYNEGILMGMNYSFSRLGLDLDNAPAGSRLRGNSNDRNFSNITSASFIAPLRVREHEFILNAFYHRIQDAYAEGTISADVVFPDTLTGAPFAAQYRMQGNIASAGVAFGTVVHERLTLGAVLGIITGDGNEFHQLDLDSSRDTSAYFERSQWFSKADLDYRGLMTTIGALYRADRWSAGAVFSPGWTLTQNLDFRAQHVVYRNQIPSADKAVFSPLVGTDREITIPYTIGVGGSYRITEDLLAAVDLQMRRFGSDGAQSRYRVQQEPPEPDAPLEDQPVEWKNLNQIRLGLEYQRHTAWGSVPLRVGFRTEPLLIGDNAQVAAIYDQRVSGPSNPGKFVPKPDDFIYFMPRTEPVSSGDQVVGRTVTFGCGVHWAQVRLDAALEWTGYKYKEKGSLATIQRCQECDPDIDPSVTEDPQWGKRKEYGWGDYSRIYDNNRLRLLLNFTGYF